MWELNQKYYKGLAWAHSIVLDAPAYEETPAKWEVKKEKDTFGYLIHIACGNCKAINRIGRTPYCPYCGKPMED